MQGTQKIYFYPFSNKNADRTKYGRYTYVGSFVDGLSELCSVVNRSDAPSIVILNPFKYIFRMDAIIFNWIESISRPAKFALFILLFALLRIRRVRIIWILHNIHPHRGETWVSKAIKRTMFKHADVIIAHSKEAKAYADERARNRVWFFHHPASDMSEFEEVVPREKKFDLFIWGEITPYKGVAELLRFAKREKADWRIKIVGRCKDAEYLAKIEENLSGRVDFENRPVSYAELPRWMSVSRYAIFPYISSSVSSSGVLMLTLSFGGISIIGPNKGAFADMAREGLCLTYDSYGDIAGILLHDEQIPADRLQAFIEENSWSNFCKSVADIIST